MKNLLRAVLVFSMALTCNLAAASTFFISDNAVYTLQFAFSDDSVDHTLIHLERQQSGGFVSNAVILSLSSNGQVTQLPVIDRRVIRGPESGTIINMRAADGSLATLKYNYLARDQSYGLIPHKGARLTVHRNTIIYIKADDSLRYQPLIKQALDSYFQTPGTCGSRL